MKLTGSLWDKIYNRLVAIKAEYGEPFAPSAVIILKIVEEPKNKTFDWWDVGEVGINVAGKNWKEISEELVRIYIPHTQQQSE